MRIGEIARSVEYLIDKQFQNLPIPWDQFKQKLYEFVNFPKIS